MLHIPYRAIYFLPGVTKHTKIMVTTEDYKVTDDDEHVAAEMEIE